MNNYWFYVMVRETKHITLYGPYSYEQCIEERDKVKRWALSPEFCYSPWFNAENEDKALDRAKRHEG